jgi:hypothetical protein
MKRFVLVLLLFLSFSGYSQNILNNYKYVVVPQKFSFLKQNDQYSLNSLTKGLLQYKGFTAYFDNELPAEVVNNRCRALNADVLENSSMFTTGLTLVLKDCQGNIVFKSKEGKSREKEYKVAYDLALRDAFTSLNQVSYTDTGSTNVPAQPMTTTASAVPVKPTVAAATVPVPSTIAASTALVKSTEAVDKQPAGTLYAQAIANGYQLIDATSKIVLTLLKTSAENYFIAGNATVNGIVLKKNEDWFFEYYKDGKLISEKLLVKF